MTQATAPVPKPFQMWTTPTSYRTVIEVGETLVYYRTARSLESTATLGAWAAWVEQTHAVCQECN